MTPLPKPSSLCKKATMPQMVTITNKPTIPQISKFLLSLESFSLPADFIYLATPKTNAKKATAAISGIILAPMSINNCIMPVKFAVDVAAIFVLLWSF